MCNPIVDKSIFPIIEPFTEENVKEFFEKRDRFDKYPLRHYSQLSINFQKNQVRELLNRLKIPIFDTRATVFGGYTGQFACCLRDIGMKVVFTDPLEEWVREALDKGFKAYKYAAEEIPKEIVKRTELFATFECYHPFASDVTSVYTILRFLTAKYGILFACSKRTFNEMKIQKGRLARMKSYFLPYKKIYSISRSEKGKGNLKIYHFYSTNNNVQKIRKDCKIIKLLYDTYPSRTEINHQNISSLIKNSGLPKDEVVPSLKRILALYQLQLNPSVRYHLPKDLCRFFSKTYYIDI